MKRQIEEDPDDDVTKKLKTSSEESDAIESTTDTTYTHEEFHKFIKETDVEKVRICLLNGGGMCDKCIEIANSLNDWEFLKLMLRMYPEGIFTKLPNGQMILSQHAHYVERLIFMVQLLQNLIPHYKTLPLVKYAIEGKLPLPCLRYLIDCGFDVNVTVHKEVDTPPLSVASHFLNDDYVSALLNGPSTTSCKSNFTYPNVEKALHFALASRHPSNEYSVLTTLKLLLKTMDNPHQVGIPHIQTLLMRACLNPHPKFGVAIVKLLIETGAHLEAKDAQGNTALVFACGLEAKNVELTAQIRSEIVQVLLDAGANPNATALQGNTPLIIATNLRNSEMSYRITNSLLIAGAIPNTSNKNNETPLNLAVRPHCENLEFQAKTVKLLLEAGADAKNFNPAIRNTLLTLALKQTSPYYPVNSDVVKLLLEYGVEISFKNPLTAKIAFYHVLMIKNGKIAWNVLQHLLNAISDFNQNIIVNSQFINYEDPVYGPKMVESLLKAGAKINVRLSLFTALKSPDPLKMFKILLAAGADPNAKHEDTTILTKTCCNDSIIAIELVKLLIEAGANVNAKNDDGNTALHECVKLSNHSTLEIVRLLLKSGARSFVFNKDCISPFISLLRQPSDSKLQLKLFEIFVHHTGLSPKTSLTFLLPRYCTDPESLKTCKNLSELMNNCDIKLTPPSQKNVKKNIFNLQGPSVMLKIKNEHLLLHNILNMFSNSDRGVQKLQNLLQSGSDPNEKSSDGTTALLIACRINNNYGPIFVEKLLKYGANPSLQDNYGNCPLSETLNYTTSSVTIQNVKNLFEAGANPNVNDVYGTPIIFSCVILNVFQKNQTGNIIKLFIETGVSTDFVDDKGRSLLFHIMNVNSDPSLVEYCLKNKCYSDINAVDKEGNTALLYLLCRQNSSNITESMKLLLESGCNPSIQNNDRNCALHFVTQNEHELETNVNLLLQYNSNPSLVNNKGECPLLNVCQLNSNQNDSIQLLLESKCDVNVQDCNGNTPLHLILKSDLNCYLIQSILDLNADPCTPNSEGETPLMLACLLEIRLAYPITCILLNAGADPNSVTKNGKNVLCYASEKCVRSPSGTLVLKKLIPLNISLTEEQKENLIINVIKFRNADRAFKMLHVLMNHKIIPSQYSRALIHACEVKDPLCAFAMITMLVKEGVDLSVTDQNGNTALMLVCKNCNCNIHYEIIKYLITNGIDTTLQNDNGEDALLFSINNQENPEFVCKIVKLILYIGIPKIKTLDTALFSAVQYSNHSVGLELVKILLKNGAQTLWKNELGNTVLHNAALIPCNGTRLVDVLLEAGADPNAQNNLGQMALFCAIRVFKQSTVDPSSVLSLISSPRINLSIQDNNGNTALFYAAEITDHKSAKVCVGNILDYGIDPSVKNKTGKTAFTTATRRTDAKMIFPRKIQEELLKHNGKPSSEDTDVLFFICKNKNMKFFKKMLPLLIEAGMNFSVTDMNGNTPLMLSLQSAHPLQKIKLLLKNVIDSSNTIDFVSKNKKNALLIAAMISDPKVAYDCVVRLLNNGANPNCDSASESPLSVALNSSHPEYGPKMVDVLLKAAGANPSYRDLYRKNSAIKVAVMNDNIDIALQNVKKLFLAGADIHGKNSISMFTWTCLISSNVENRHIILKYLIECGAENEVANSDNLFTLFTPINLSDCLLKNQALPFDGFCLFINSIFDFITEYGVVKKLEFVKHRIHKMLDIGIFNLSSPNIVSPVTLLVKFDTSSAMRSSGVSRIVYTLTEKRCMILSLVKEFVSRGADISQRLFKFRNPVLQNWSDMLQLPDALFMAAFMGNIESMMFLLDYWAVSPLALLIFLAPSHCSDPQRKSHLKNVLRQIIPHLMNGCPLPLGSLLYYRVAKVLEFALNEELIAEDVIDAFHNMHSVVPSLLEMSRISVRCAILSGPDYSEKISQLCIPQELIQLLLRPNPIDL